MNEQARRMGVLGSVPVLGLSSRGAFQWVTPCGTLLYSKSFSFRPAVKSVSGACSRVVILNQFPLPESGKWHFWFWRLQDGACNRIESFPGHNAPESDN